MLFFLGPRTFIELMAWDERVGDELPCSSLCHANCYRVTCDGVWAGTFGRMADAVACVREAAGGTA